MPIMFCKIHSVRYHTAPLYSNVRTAAMFGFSTPRGLSSTAARHKDYVQPSCACIPECPCMCVCVCVCVWRVVSYQGEHGLIKVHKGLAVGCGVGHPAPPSQPPMVHPLQRSTSEGPSYWGGHWRFPVLEARRRRHVVEGERRFKSGVLLCLGGRRRVKEKGDPAHIGEGTGLWSAYR